MHSEQNALLAQVPLTVSPFVTLPKAPTLPHNYASIPSTLPPSVLTPSPSDQSDDNGPPPYVTSASGFRAHPSAIIAQNQALRDQLDNAPVEGHRQIRAWRTSIEQRDLAEKRRKAPGWLDSEDKILRPENSAAATSTATTSDARAGASLLDADNDHGALQKPQESGTDLGAQMDRAFG